MRQIAGHARDMLTFRALPMREGASVLPGSSGASTQYLAGRHRRSFGHPNLRERRRPAIGPANRRRLPPQAAAANHATGLPGRPGRGNLWQTEDDGN